MRTVEVFQNVRYVRRRKGPYNVGYRMEAVARGNGTVLYTTRTCDSEAEASALYRNYMARNPQYVDTTRGKVSK
jgi:hypothetical protein